MFPRRYRLTNKASFVEIKKRGRFINDGFINIGFLESQGGVKVGIIASKNFSRKAVERNRAKRIMRRSINPFLDNIKVDCNILLIAGKKILTEDEGELQLKLRKNLKQLKLL